MGASKLVGVWASLALTLVTSAGASAQSPVTWSDAGSFSPGFVTTGLALADVTGSPLPDMLMTTSSGNLLRILENLGPAQVPPAIDLPVGQGPGEIAVADLDGDGDKDIVTRNASNVSVLIRQPAGTYVRTDCLLGGPGRLGIADVDVNGLPDIVRGSHAILATAPGVFGAATALLGTLANPIDAAMGDIDGNGAVDLVVVYGGQPGLGAPVSVDIRLNAGNGTFGPPTSSALLPSVGSFSYACADLDQDGDSDLLLLAGTPNSTARVFPAASGLFLPPLLPETIEPLGAGSSYDPRFFDVDGDGRLDALVQVNHVVGIATLTHLWNVALINDGTGRLRVGGVPFLGEQVFSFPPLPPFAVGDLDGDGDGDFIGQKLGLVGIRVKLAQVMPSVSLAAASGGGQATDLGESFASPLVVSVSSGGAPSAGVQVSWSVSPAGAASITPPGPVLTDALGNASVAVTPLLGGPAIVAASIAGPTPDVAFSLFTRSLGATGSAAIGSIAITYSHEHGPVPFILAADVPQPAPIVTPYGLIKTSILAPGPALVVLDGMGLFGPPIPSIVANPGFTLTLGLPPSVGGLAIVLQAYGLDAAYMPDLTQAIFVSNAVPRTL